MMVDTASEHHPGCEYFEYPRWPIYSKVNSSLRILLSVMIKSEYEWG